MLTLQNLASMHASGGGRVPTGRHLQKLGTWKPSRAAALATLCGFLAD